MSKNKNKNKNPQRESFDPSQYYELKTKAVDDLVTADESNSPEVSEKELMKYRSGPKIRIAEWVKFLFIKWWFPAAVCFFFMWGLGGYMDYLDNVVVTAIALGIVTDLLTNNAMRFLEKVPGAASRWMMFPKKGYASFPLNILYALVLMFLVFMTYNVINYTVIHLLGKPGDVPILGVEPILFGVFWTAFDMLLISMKHLGENIIRDARKPGR